MKQGFILLFLYLNFGNSILGQDASFPFLTDTAIFEKVSEVALTEQLNNTLLCDNAGYIWVGSNAGLYRFDGYNWLKFEQPVNSLNQPIDPATTGILQGPDDKFWRTSHKSGLVKFNYQNDVLENIRPGDSSQMSIHNVMSDNPYWLSKDTLVLKTKLGFFFYDVSTKTISNPIIPYRDSISLLSSGSESNYFGNAIRGVVKHRTKSNLLWITTAKELLSYDMSASLFEQIPIPFHNDWIDRPIPPIDVFHYNDDLIVTTWGAGIATYNLTSKTWTNTLLIKPLTPDVGLYNAIHELRHIKDDLFIYAGSDHIGLYNHKSKTSSPFTIKDDYQLGHFTNAMVDHQGVVWAISYAGVFRSKHSLFPTKQETKLNITECRVNNTNHNLDKSDGNVMIQVPLEGNVSIKVAKINPIYPNQYLYEYRLEGFDKNWITMTPTQEINYSNILGGSHDFEVKVMCQDQNPTIHHLATIDFEVYFYEKLWFKLMIAFLLGLGFYLYNRNRIEKIKSEERITAQFENQIIKMEMQALRSQMNPHFIFNSLNSIKNYVVNKGPMEAADYLTKFSQLIRVILENSKSELLSLEQEIKALKLYIEIENKRFKNKFDFNIEVDFDIDTNGFKIPPMLIQPYIENAIWHGLMHKNGQRKLLIQFLQMEDGILCIVEDNGIGREASNQIGAAKIKSKISLGTAITNDRIEAINRIHHNLGKVKIEDLQDKDQPSGTRVKIFIRSTKENLEK